MIGEDLSEFTARTRADIDAVVAAGGTAYLVSAVHLDLDAQIGGEGSPPSGVALAEVAAMSARGWEVVAALPRTASVAQQYDERSKMTMRDWGGQRTVTMVPFSGNVVGTYLLLRLPITKQTRALHDGEIEPACARILAAGASRA